MIDLISRNWLKCSFFLFLGCFFTSFHFPFFATRPISFRLYSNCQTFILLYYSLFPLILKYINLFYHFQIAFHLIEFIITFFDSNQLINLFSIQLLFYFPRSLFLNSILNSSYFILFNSKLVLPYFAFLSPFTFLYHLSMKILFCFHHPFVSILFL